MNGRCDSDEALDFLLRHEIRAPADRRNEETPRLAHLPEEEEQQSMPVPMQAGVAAAGCFAGCQLGTLLGLGMLVTGLCSVGGCLAGYAYSGQAERRRLREEQDEEEAEQDRAARARGLDANVIQSNSVEQEYKAPQCCGGSEDSKDEDDELNQCMVCLETFKPGDKLRQLPCLHRYHCHCIDKWLERSSQCPICKRDITDDAPPPPKKSAAQPPLAAGGSRGERRERSAVGQWIARNTKEARRRSDNVRSAFQAFPDQVRSAENVRSAFQAFPQQVRSAAA